MSVTIDALRAQIARAPQRAAQRRKRKDRQRRERLPLFAALGEDVLDSVAPLPTVSEYERQERLIAANTYARALKRERMGLRSWLRYRALAERYITRDQVAHMEAFCRRVLPDDPAYRADYWWRALCEAGLVRGKGKLTVTAAMRRGGLAGGTAGRGPAPGARGGLR